MIPLFEKNDPDTTATAGLMVPALIMQLFRVTTELPLFCKIPVWLVELPPDPPVIVPEFTNKLAVPVHNTAAGLFPPEKLTPGLPIIVVIFPLIVVMPADATMP
jgi:hypothetical protein